MKDIAILISPVANGAYFNETIDIAQKEFTQCIGEYDLTLNEIGGMQFLQTQLPEQKLEVLARLSFVQGIFSHDSGTLTPLSLNTDFNLHSDFVFGSKYKGKTNEILTQLLLNVGLSFCKEKDVSKIKLLDPMCGRGTTLMWAMRYGIKSKGIEQDPNAVLDFRTFAKKWTKLHRQKHELKEGFIGKANKQNKGKFIDFTAEGVNTRIINGNATTACDLLKREKQHLIISDIPYGVQHFTTEKTRNPIAVLEDCAPQWADLLHKDGICVIAFNKYIPKRKELIAVFEAAGLSALEFEAPHRMSESIFRDVVVLRKN
ncbi:TRM11 family SAM-dependent methyltransferase [Pseudoalteromonas sp. G4]|uniref:TRM11 family SAM-dependent methyltransferase n=1 Tax=Pseudoalteromonas sp. G4 TaxID=2992761 RepID=UPI00237ED47C|nr:hypothetical protein [Pseudoalteromonas sp. G4]MDE3274090.1 hypothetical protein [Pseudoalteromonas sp. G4]